MIQFKRAMPIKEMEKKKLQLEENYNFKEEEDKSWSFEFRGRKAFFINLCNHSNINIITPFIMRRGELAIICNLLNDQLENDQLPTNLSDFLNHSVEVIGNMLDKRKMGSVHYFISTLWKDIERNTNSYIMVVNRVTDIISMIDCFSELQLSSIPQETMKKIHNDYFNIDTDKQFRIHPDGSIEQVSGHDYKPQTEKKQDDPEDPYGLTNMRPINNRWEI